MNEARLDAAADAEQDTWFEGYESGKLVGREEVMVWADGLAKLVEALDCHFTTGSDLVRRYREQRAKWTDE